MSIGELRLVVVVVAIASIGFAFYKGVDEVGELEWKKQKAVDDLEAMRQADAEEARQRIIAALNDEGMK